MRQRKRHFAAIMSLGLLPLLAAAPLAAKSPGTAATDNMTQYIVVLDEAPLALWHREQVEASRQSLEAGGRSGQRKRLPRLDVNSAESKSYLRHIDESFEEFRGEASLKLRRELRHNRRYRNALNGFAATMTAQEAKLLEAMPGVKSVHKEENHRIETDAGPTWIGADHIWSGVGSIPQTRGEGIIIGVIDSGINWDHQAFSDPGSGLDFTNPLGTQKGLCSDPEVMCNDKLIGVYDFVVDKPETDVAEENTKGRDNSGHGTHVASIAAGNILSVTNNGLPFQISGVAPHANIISYRVCFEGDPNDSEDDSCQGSAIIDAIDQAVADGVDVINYSLGAPPPPGSPWGSLTSSTFLNAFGAGVFVATSASNEGPAPSSIGSPANAPWISSIGNASHNRVFGNLLQSMTGGDTTPPANMIGASLTGTSGFRDIVHARDFGNALCGTGTEELGSTCNDNTGATNPFAPGTFNGQIVVCDRGQYGRIEKSKNLQLAGAAGMILANTDEQGESIVAAEFCIPGIHIGDNDGDELRSWLDSGSNHKGLISAFTRVFSDSLADQISDSSSRGPGLPPVEDVMKPNMIAPGNSILAPYIAPSNYAFLSGTSMSSPHVAGAAALLLAANNSWTPSMISSALELTATPDLASDFDGGPSTTLEHGAGRPRLGDAANIGLYLNETLAGFQAANPAIGGDPKSLNLPGLTDAACQEICSFTRTVTDLAGGRAWSAAANGFPAGVVVTVTPSDFTLSNGGSRDLEINIDLSSGSIFGDWVFGNVVLSATGVPDAVLPVSVYASGGELPFEWNITTDQSSGWQEFSVGGLANMPQATFTAGGLLKPQNDSAFLTEDNTNSDPYDGGSGVMTVWHEVPEGALWLTARTITSTAQDLDLYLGRDNNNDGVVDSTEQLCSSITETDIELCEILNPPAGDYWMLVQNWSGSAAATDEATLVSAVISPSNDANLVATGPGIVMDGADFDLRVNWNDVSATPGEELLGAVGIGTSSGNPANIGVIPVHFERSGIAASKTLPLVEGYDHQFALAGMSAHEHAFIDVPPGVSRLSVSASGLDSAQNNGLVIDMYLMAFDDAFDDAPFASNALGGAPVFSVSGSGGNGPVAVASGPTVQPGRWYAVIRNTSAQNSSVTVRAELEYSGEKLPVNGNLLVSVNRSGISQGIDFQPVGPSNGLIWYTYLDNHNPAWYLSAGAAGEGNRWSGDLLRFTNDGSSDRFSGVGHVSVTSLAENDSIFSWTLFGESGSERMAIITGSDTNPCVNVDNQPTSISGLWGKAQAGLGGASVLLISGVHAEIHYLYDMLGNPVWLQAGGLQEGKLILSQFQGACPTCASSPVSSSDVGLLDASFASQASGDWNLDYVLVPPLTGDIDRDDSVIKLSDVRTCD